jgi:hypothetical protein
LVERKRNRRSTFFIGVDINSVSPSIMGREDLDCGLLWYFKYARVVFL